jgi:hypothetical protein
VKKSIDTKYPYQAQKIHNSWHSCFMQMVDRGGRTSFMLVLHQALCLSTGEMMYVNEKIATACACTQQGVSGYSQAMFLNRRCPGLD